VNIDRQEDMMSLRSIKKWTRNKIGNKDTRQDSKTKIQEENLMKLRIRWIMYFVNNHFRRGYRPKNRDQVREYIWSRVAKEWTQIHEESLKNRRFYSKTSQPGINVILEKQIVQVWNVDWTSSGYSPTVDFSECGDVPLLHKWSFLISY
jgi:hypothetical protein